MIFVTPTQTFERVDGHWEPVSYKPSYGPEITKSEECNKEPWWKDYSCSFIVTHDCCIRSKQFVHEIHLKMNTTAVTEYF